MDKSKYIPLGDWKNNCSAIYYLENGCFAYHGVKPCWMAVDKNEEKYFWSTCEKTNLPCLYEIITFKLKLNQNIKSFISAEAIKVWPLDNDTPSKYYRLVDRGHYFETVEI